MQLVEGPTLSDRVAHGPIPVDEALPTAKQIAEANDRACNIVTGHFKIYP